MIAPSSHAVAHVPKPKAFMLNVVKRHQHQNGGIDNIWAALNRSSGLHTLQLHHDPARQPGRANALLQAIASALGTVLIAHAFVRRTVVSYLAYIANLPLSCVFCSSASPHAEPGVFDVTTTQSGWWWREHAAQAA